MKKPMIGVLPLWDDKKSSIWMLPGYLNGILDAGGIPVILPLTKDKKLARRLAEEFDGFLFTGGHDVSPSLYGEEKLLQCGQICSMRDYLEQALFAEVIKINKPAFGICRGIQAFNVFLGGSLYQDLGAQFATEDKELINHKQTPPYDIPIHSVSIHSSPLSQLIDAKEVKVNSYHHQAIKSLSPELSPMAYSPDGIIEAVYMPGMKYIWAVQWHPEYALSNEVSKKLFFSFVSACSDYS